MRRTRIAGLALAPVAALVATALFPAPAAAQGMPPAPVIVDEAREEILESRRRVTGEVRAARRSLLASEVEGIVEALLFAEGDQIKAGDEVARLDAKLADLAVREARALAESRSALVDQRTAELEDAQLDLERVRRLALQSNVTSQAELDNARTTMAAAAARLEQARADMIASQVVLERAAVALTDFVVRAPFDGYVLRKSTEVGQWVRPGDPVVEVVSLDPIEVWLNVPEAWIDQLAEGTAVTIEVPSSGYKLDVEVAKVVPAGDPLSRLFPVRASVSNPDMTLKPGMRVTGVVPTGRRAPVLTVHKDAVLRDDAGAFVYFVAGPVAGVARIETLFSVGERVAVKAPALQPGSQVVVEGNERLFPGRPLAPRPRTSGSAASSGPASGAAAAGSTPEAASSR